MQKILKIKFNKITLTSALGRISNWENDNEQRYIVTPNPEIVLTAQKNPKFLKILNHANLNIADGIGILWAAKYLQITINNKSKFIKTLKWLFTLATIAIYPKYIRTSLPERVTGVDLMKSIIKQTDKRIFLLGAAEGVAEEAAKKLASTNIIGSYSGSPKDSEASEIIKQINESEAELLFVAYGAPAQEIWISRHLKKLKNIKLAIGVGGAFDFISGAKKRAPKWMQKLGIEWLYRIIQEPKRFGRIFNATIRFPLTILRSSFKN